MRTLLYLVVLGAASLGFVGAAPPPARTAGGHEHGGRATLGSYPQGGAARLVPDYPPTTPYRSPFFFPGSMKPRAVREVRLYDNYFSPSVLWVAEGTEVRFVNHGRHHHTATCDWAWESGELGKGKSFSLTFTRPGTYYYYCRHHAQLMRGTVTVY